MGNKNKYGLVGYASDLGGLYEGARIAPRVFRTRGLIQALENIGVDIKDYGDIDSPLRDICQGNQDIHCYKSLIECHKKLSALVQKVVADKRIPLVLGGDHSLSIGSFSALVKASGKRQGLLWIDTHADINTPKSSPSKRAFGMPIACLLGETKGYFEVLVPSDKPALAPEDIVYVGLRDVDEGEKVLLGKLGLKCYTMHDIDYHGIGKIIKDCQDYFRSQGITYAVSFDLDVCDPSIVPGTGTPKRGGLSYREAHLALELLSQTEDVSMWELVELNPLLDHEYSTADIAVSLIESALGKSIL